VKPHIHVAMAEFNEAPPPPGEENVVLEDAQGDVGPGAQAGGAHVQPPQQQPPQQQQFQQIPQQNVPMPPGFFNFYGGQPPFWPPNQMWPPQFYPPQVAAPPQQHREARPDRVKLGSFLQSKAGVWFNLAEASMDLNNVVDPRTRYNVVLSGLPNEVVAKLGAVSESPESYGDPYLALKTRVLELYKPSKWENITQLLTFRELGGMKPTDLMAEMMALLPVGMEPCLLFKGLFLLRMPAEMQEHLQLRVDELTCQQLAEQADALWVARNRQKAKVLAALPLPPKPDEATEELTDAVAAIQLKKSGPPKKGRFVRNNRGGSKKQESRRDGPKDLCNRHQRYGGRAWECEKPDTFLLANQTSGN